MSGKHANGPGLPPTVIIAYRTVLFLAAGLVVLCYTSPVCADDASELQALVYMPGGSWTSEVLDDLREGYGATGASIEITSSSTVANKNGRLRKSPVSVFILTYRMVPIMSAQKGPIPGQLKDFFAGQRRLVVITNRRNSVEKISLTQIQQLLRKEGNGTKWQALGGSATAIKCYGEDKRSWCRDTIRRKCMAYTEKFDWGSRSGWYPFRDDFEECSDAAEVIKKVRKDSNGIGFFLYRGQPIKGLDKVKILAIGRTDKGPFVRPKLEAVIQKDYPLSEPLILYLHPKAPPLARKFCEFAVGPQGAKIAASYGLITPYAQKQAEAQKRLAAMWAGQGVRMAAVGVRAGRGLLKGLAVEYVKAKAVVQMGYNVAGDLRAIEQFVRSGAGAKELMILDGPPSKRAIERYGEKFEALKAQKYPLAGKAVAVVVNSLNTLDSLSMAQLQDIYGKKTKDWKTLTTEPQRTQSKNGTGNKERGTRANKSAVKSTIDNRKSTIHCYAIRRPDAAAMLFHKKVLVHHKCSAMRRRGTLKNTTDVLKAVSMDPQAIAFVDAAALARAEKNPAIKILKISEAAKNPPTALGGRRPVFPTAKNVISGAYPISQRLTLYVSPQASKTTKDFIKFILSSQCDETFHKNGLLPAQ